MNTKYTVDSDDLVENKNVNYLNNFYISHMFKWCFGYFALKKLIKINFYFFNLATRTFQITYVVHI